MIYIVSGVARSGKSLVMQMLRAGGIELSYDENYLPANEFNENGFFEYSNPDDLLSDPAFVTSMDGQAINVVAHQFVNLPWRLRPLAKVIWVDRDLRAVYESQCRVNKKSGAEILPWDEFYGITRNMVRRAYTELNTYYHFHANYDTILKEPLESAVCMEQLLQPRSFDVQKAAEVVSPRLRHFE